MDVQVREYEFQSITRRGGYVEVRLYAGDQRGQERRLERRTYRMVQAHHNYTFPPKDVCDNSDSASRYDRYLKIWVSARNHDGSPMNDYEARERRAHVSCAGWVWGGLQLARLAA
ncbi:MAG: hypothetical protein HY549_10995 [Elusimicrobia bacterium]|nr:hypothetical protein [Elusimicrobiota bacterium]